MLPPMSRLALPAHALVALLALAGCGTSAPQPPAAPAAPALAVPAEGWVSSLDRAHPLVGRIWSVREGRFVDERTVRAALRGYVLLGEKHDNPDHHALQARLLDAMVADGRRPVVAFEMLDLEAQPKIDAARAAAGSTPESIAAAADWEHSGWPDFAIYRPVFRAALATSQPLLGTGLPSSTLRGLVRGTAAAPEPVPAAAALDPEQLASLREELVASHCGHLPATMVDGMVRAQRARDATMARVLAAGVARGATDAVLVAGSGHARRDRGVPRDLAIQDPTRSVTSIGFVEVEHERGAPGDYAARWKATALPFDYAWFTPRASDEDPCAGMRGP